VIGAAKVRDLWIGFLIANLGLIIVYGLERLFWPFPLWIWGVGIVSLLVGVAALAYFTSRRKIESTSREQPNRKAATEGKHSVRFFDEMLYIFVLLAPIQAIPGLVQQWPSPLGSRENTAELVILAFSVALLCWLSVRIHKRRQVTGSTK